SPRHTGGSGGADTASTEISPSLTCENHVQHGKQVLTSTTLIRPNTCPRMAQCPDMLVRLPPRCTQCNRTPHFFFQNHEGATPDLVPLPRRSGSRLRLIDHERVTSRPIQLKAHPGRLRCELARMRSVTMGAENDHKGVRAAIRPSPSGDRADLAAFFQGASGPVCEQAEHMLPSLVLARGRRPLTRHRRAGSPVAEPTPICFSPDSAPSAGAEQSSERGQRIVIDSPPLAQPAVGSGSIQYVS